MVNEEVSELIQYQHFKIEGMKNLKPLIQREDWLIKIDLQDAYFAYRYKPKSTQVAEVHLGMQAIPIYMPLLQVSTGKNGHEVDGISG